MAGESETLEATPTWAVATVCFVLISVSILIEHGLHLLAQYLGRKRRKSLLQALNKIKSDLMLLGFISLLLTVSEKPISNICIPSSMAESFLPCQTLTSDQDEESKYPRRFQFIHQTSFGRRHLKFWSENKFLRLPACFLRQFYGSVYKVDYFTLRHGFITAHFAEGTNFDFQKYLKRALEKDLGVVVGMRLWIWIFSVLFIFFNAYVFRNYAWLPFIPLIILLIVGTKLQSIITKMCLDSVEKSRVVRGTLLVKPSDHFFWFDKPKFLLHLMHFISFQVFIKVFLDY